MFPDWSDGIIEVKLEDIKNIDIIRPSTWIGVDKNLWVEEFKKSIFIVLGMIILAS